MQHNFVTVPEAIRSMSPEQRQKLNRDLSVAFGMAIVKATAINAALWFGLRALERHLSKK